MHIYFAILRYAVRCLVKGELPDGVNCACARELSLGSMNCVAKQRVVANITITQANGLQFTKTPFSIHVATQQITTAMLSIHGFKENNYEQTKRINRYFE